MELPNQDVCLQKLEEFIQDEDKIVTSTLLSREVRISVNDAKEILAKYVKDFRQSNSNSINVVYVLSGNLSDGSISVFLCKEHELEEKRNLFHKIFSEQIYSIQKCKDIDLQSLTLAEPINSSAVDIKPILGAIIGQNCVKRERKLTEIVTIKKENSTNYKSTETKSSFNKEAEKPKSKTSKNNGIKDLFANASTKKPETSKSTKVESSNTQKRKGDEGGIKSLFANAAAKKSKNIVENKDEPAVGEKENQDTLNMETEDEVVVVNETETKDKIKNKKKRTKKEIKSQPAKKRKRIVERNDSDSDDIFGDDSEKDEDIIAASEEEPEEPVYIPEKPLLPKNKHGKYVNTTSMDEEGYVVTKREWVYESGPEEDDNTATEIKEKKVKKEEPKKEHLDDENLPKKDKAKKLKKNNSSGTNQPTLMNFFKKK